MKKFILTANVIAILFLVPSVLFGYLHKTGTKTTVQETSTASGEPKSGHAPVSIFGLVKTF